MPADKDPPREKKERSGSRGSGFWEGGGKKGSIITGPVGVKIQKTTTSRPLEQTQRQGKGGGSTQSIEKAGKETSEKGQVRENTKGRIPNQRELVLSIIQKQKKL